MKSCWCGNTQFKPFGEGYGCCEDCNTLVYQGDVTASDFLVKDEEIDLYGKQYWTNAKQENEHNFDIYTRSQSDLSERNLHWLRTLLKFKSPPGKVMELGCGHGSFVSLLNQSGFDAFGIEMSPWVVEFGKKTFKVPVFLGPIENLQISPGSLDAIVLMDVLEHLPDPVETIAVCLKLLVPNGIILIQTPQFREGTTYTSLKMAQSRFIEMLIPKEHLYLFSKNSIIQLFKTFDVNHAVFEPALFSEYDMYFAVSRTPLEESWNLSKAALLSNPIGRTVLALLEVYQRGLAFHEKLIESDADRTARGQQIDQLTKMLQESDADRTARDLQIERQRQNIGIFFSRRIIKLLLKYLKWPEVQNILSWIKIDEE